MKTRIIMALTLAALSISCWAVQLDKAQKDSVIFARLNEPVDQDIELRKLYVIDDSLTKSPTGERGIYLHKGKHFKNSGYVNDVYMKRRLIRNVVLNDASHPLELFVNMMQGYVDAQKRTAVVNHHQYGGRPAVVMLPLGQLISVLGEGRDAYIAVFSATDGQIKAAVIFHERKLNEIHMMEVQADLRSFKDKDSQVDVELYTNIPQNNIKDLFSPN